MTTVGTDIALSAHTTLGLGGPALRLEQAATEAELIAAVRAADAAGEPLLVLGGGSNLVVGDAGFPGTVIKVATRGVSVTSAADAVDVTVAAGEPWDAFVARAVAEGLAGVECLSGIPGLAGATPIQNVGAYGQEVSRVITAVRALDRSSSAVITLTGEQCAFGYRTSLLKRAAAGRPTGPLVVLDVTFRLRRQPLSEPVRYAQLAAALGVDAGTGVPLADARAAVLELRSGKAMVLDPADPDTRSAGSFFTNPVLTAEQYAELQERYGPGAEVPHFPATEPDALPGTVKVPAAWLIEQAGFARGYCPGGGPDSPRISTKHTLALVNPGHGSTSALLALAADITAGVRDSFHINLVPEPVLVGVTLP